MASNRRIKKHISMIIAGVIMLMCIFPAYAAENTAVLRFEVTYGQTEARKMAELVNDFRTSDTWKYDENNNRISVTGLKALAYDYDLEKAAMQRAAELAVSYSHTRPNGERCFTAYSWQAAGENIAYGYKTFEGVFDAWKEEYDDYSGQGHRRNMLGEYFMAIGIGHVVYNGVHYWVQEFRAPTGSTKVTSPNDSATEVNVETTTDKITSINLSCGVSSIRIAQGDTGTIPEVVAQAEIGNSKNITLSGADIQWTMDDPAIADLEGGVIHGKSAGKTQLRGELSLGNQKGTVSVVVEVYDKQEESILLGDVNGDQKVDANDLTTLARHLAKISVITSEVRLKAADTDQDGRVSSEDLTHLAKYVSRIIPSL